MFFPKVAKQHDVFTGSIAFGVLMSAQKLNDVLCTIFILIQSYPYPVIISSDVVLSGDSPKIPPAMGHALKKRTSRDKHGGFQYMVS